MTTTAPNRQIQIAPETVTKLDSVAQDYQLSSAEATPFTKTFLLAGAINQMRDLLTPEVMRPVMALMNTDLGFRTDKDPHQFDSKTGKPHVPYTEAVVRDVLIESTLRGFYPVNNEFNIIAGRFYAAKNGIRRKVQKYPGLTDLKETYGVPRTVGEKGAVVTCKAQWKMTGIADELEREIPVRVNASMGTDAILGKAERKLLKSVLDRISGEITPDGEIDDESTGSTVPGTPKVVVAKSEKTVSSRELKQEPEGGQSEKPEIAPTTPAASEPQNEGPTSEEIAEIERKEAQAAAVELAEGDPAGALLKIMEIDAITTDELGHAMRAFNLRIPRDFKGPDSLTDKTIQGLMEAKAWNTIRTFILGERAKKQEAP